MQSNKAKSVKEPFSGQPSNNQPSSKKPARAFVGIPTCLKYYIYVSLVTVTAANAT